MKIKSVIMAIIICICHSLNIAYASASGITCTTEIDGNNVSISGQIPNASAKNQITVLAGTTDNIIYINQFESAADGTFNYSFPIAENVPYGDYNLKIGSNSGYAPYEGVLSYSAPSAMVRNKFIEADLTVALNWYVPQISGTILCTAGKTMTMTVINKTDNTVIANDTMTSANGVYNLSYSLPSLVSAKEYEISFSCVEGDKSLASVNVNIDSSILAVDVTGTVNTAENVEVEAQIQSTSTSLIDKSKVFSGSKSISETIPNVIPNASFRLTAQAYESVPEDTPQCEYILSSAQDDESVIFINVSDIGILKNKLVVIEYNPETLTLTDGCALTPQKELSAVTLHNSGVEIVSVTEGKAVFRFNRNADEGYKFSGTINALKFKSKTAGEKVIICKVID